MKYTMFFYLCLMAASNLFAAAIDTEWFNAIKANDLGEVEKLESTVNINTQDSHGNSGLIWAVFWGNDSIVNFLVKQPKINLDIQNSFGRTALMEAALAGNSAIAAVLLKGKADPNILDMDNNSALIFAVHRRHVRIVALVLQHEANANIRNKQGKTALDLAHGEDVGDIRAYINRAREEREKALLNAARDSKNSRVIFLHGIGTNINIQGDYDLTPLMWAASRNNKELVDILLKFGADITAQNSRGETAEIIARTAGYDDLAEHIARAAKEKEG